VPFNFRNRQVYIFCNIKSLYYQYVYFCVYCVVLQRITKRLVDIGSKNNLKFDLSKVGFDYKKY